MSEVTLYEASRRRTRTPRSNFGKSRIMVDYGVASKVNFLKVIFLKSQLAPG